MKRLYVVLSMMLLVAPLTAETFLGIDAVSQGGFASRNETGLALFQNPASLPASSNDTAKHIFVGYGQKYFISMSDVLLSAGGAFGLGKAGALTASFNLTHLAPMTLIDVNAVYGVRVGKRVQLGVRALTSLRSRAEVVSFTSTLAASQTFEAYLSLGALFHITEGVRAGVYVADINIMPTDAEGVRPIRLTAGGDFDMPLPFMTLNIAFSSGVSISDTVMVDSAFTLGLPLTESLRVLTGFSFYDAGKGMFYAVGAEYASESFALEYAYRLPLVSMIAAGEHALSVRVSF